MKRLIVLFIGAAFFLAAVTSSAQERDLDGVLNGAYVKSRIDERKPPPYQYVRESDVMWAKTVWRIIDLNQKINHKLYYPETSMPNEGRYSLIDLMLHSIRNEGLKAFDPDADIFNEFHSEMTLEQIKAKFGAEDTEIEVEDANGNLVKKKIDGEIKSMEVKELMVKEEWFFDKQRSVMEVRIIGLCPIRHYYKPEDIDMEDIQKAKLFWISFVEFRKLLADHLVFNPYNESQSWSFDDIFHNRFFGSYIVQESNTYNNRMIQEYTMGKEALLEAERVKTKIMNYEMDMWEY
jgi:gliding motility associated protien GldN